MDIALANLKPGVGKTTSAVWLAAAFYQAGYDTWLFDCDPAASTLAWSDRIAAKSEDGTGFPFRIVGLAVKDVHRRAHDYGDETSVRIFDTPQIEDHAAIVRSVVRLADEVVLPVAPNGIEIERMGPVDAFLEDIESLRDTPMRTSVLLNRVDNRSKDADYWAAVLTNGGFDVLATRIPAVRLFSQAFGNPATPAGTAYATLLTELLNRHQESR